MSFSFLEELKKELNQADQETAYAPAEQDADRMARFVAEELSYIGQEIKEASRAGRFKTEGERRIFEGTRLWHEGEHRHQTDSLATFYSFLSQENTLNKELLSQRKRPLFGYHFSIRYSLSDKGRQYFSLFSESMKAQGITISSLFIRDDDGKPLELPHTVSGNVKYDFELEHHINDYPKLYYTYRVEV